VTTIPAAAYLGVAAALGEFRESAGALGVLGTNVAMMVVGAVATLALQDVFAHRDAPRGVAAPSEVGHGRTAVTVGFGRVGRPSYTVVARYNPHEARWSLEGVDLPAGYELLSQAQRVNDLETAARAGIGLLLDVPRDSFDVEVVLDPAAPPVPEFL
jgi:hypothetical protein